MRRLFALLTAGLALVTFACSSSDDSKDASSTTTTATVVVSAANKATCDAIATYQKAADAPLSVPEDGDPAENAKSIQAFLTTLVAPLEAAEAAAPAELKPSISTLVVTGKATVALDPTDPTAQATIGKALLVPEADVTAAREELISWSKTNCGIEVK